MEVKLDPGLVDKINNNRLREDWGAIARRVTEFGPRWTLVWHTYRMDPGITPEIRSRLAKHNCRAQVVSIVGIGYGPRPWTGVNVYARIPR